MLSTLAVLASSLICAQALLPVQTITSSNGARFENLAVRSNGQILTTSTGPNSSVYQVDPLGILPLTLVYELPGILTTSGISEGSPDVFYVASGNITLTTPLVTFPSTYAVTEIDMRGVHVTPNGTLNQQPVVKHIASLPNAALLNGAAFASPGSDNLLIAESLYGLIWNVNVSSGAVGVTLNDTTTKGPTSTGPGATGINGLKVFNGTLYYTNTGRSAMFKVAVDEEGNIPSGATPSLITANITCDDFTVDVFGNAFVTSPLDILTKVSPNGTQEIIAGTFYSNSSSLIGPTSAALGRLASDQWSLYVTTDGGLVGAKNLSAAGVSRINLVY